jgi:hypothetical protein
MDYVYAALGVAAFLVFSYFYLVAVSGADPEDHC